MGKRSRSTASAAHVTCGIMAIEPRQRWQENLPCFFLPPLMRFSIMLAYATVGYARAYGTRSPTARFHRRAAACLSMPKAKMGEVISKLARNGQRMVPRCAGNGLSRGVPTAKSVS